MKVTKKILSIIVGISVIIFCLPMNVWAIEEQSNKDNIEMSVGEIGGYLSGSYQTLYKLYSERRFIEPQGHGFAAERANNLSDRFRFKDATIVGDDNATNGPDRKIINRDGSTVYIQDKYCRNATETLNAAFENDSYRYLDNNGIPMQLEVPSDQYDKAVEIMRKKIQEGKVKGVTDPKEAENIVRKGHYTYDQVKNIAKAGNIDSLKYDAKNGIVVASCAMGISFVMDYASSIINGCTPQEALKQASLNGIKTGGFVFATYVISSQIAKTAIAGTITKPAAEAIAKVLGKNISKSLAQTFGVNVAALSEKQIAEQVVKILQKEIVTDSVIIVVLSIGDVIDLFRGRISKEQLLKNLSVTIASVGGASVGSKIGGVVGSAIVPGIGTTIGTIAGGAIGGVAGGLLADQIMDRFLEDDATEMFNIISEQFQKNCDKYLVSEKEADIIVDNLQKSLKDKNLKDMYASDNREEYADEFMKPFFEKQIAQRSIIPVPKESNVRQEIMSDLNPIICLH